MPGRKELAHQQLVICDKCGSYGRYQVYMTYMVLSLFFIPVFKWKKEYYVQMSCCNTIYRLEAEAGRAIERGEKMEILSSHLTLMQEGEKAGYKKCVSCGYETRENFEFCPKCGRKFTDR